MLAFSRRAVTSAAAVSSCVALAPLLATVSLAQAPAGPSVRVRATVEKLDGNTLTVKTNDGREAAIRLADNARVLGVVRAGIDEVKVGSYVGISSMPQGDGAEKAIHVHIFPEAMRGVAEGHFPWDNRPGSMMTNANVEMAVAGNDGRTLTVKYKGTERKIVVPAEAVVVKYVPGDRAQLAPGAKIFIAGAAKQPDGSLSAANVSVGLDGLTPPM